MDRLVQTLNEWAPFIDAVAWPLTAFGIALMFRRSIRDLMIGDEVSVTGPSGISITSKRSADATRSLLRASASRSAGSFLSPRRARRQVDVITRAIDRLGRRPRLLWVDDRPSNNRYEVNALRAMGVRIKQVTSTEQGLEELARATTAYDVLITDMGRGPVADAGYQLLEQLRSNGNQIPVAIYAASRKRAHFDESIEHGALGCTNMPEELFGWSCSPSRMRNPSCNPVSSRATSPPDTTGLTFAPYVGAQ